MLLEQHGAADSGIRFGGVRYCKYFLYIYLISFAGRAAVPFWAQSARSVNKNVVQHISFLKAASTMQLFYFGC
jgi:hypothetical protein